jgi:polypeptide N-acetylgalactosaminyltransferase
VTALSAQNYMRVVEVWMDDEHKEYYYTREPLGRGAPIGDISKQLQFKKDHNCKSFKWFMENVAYEVYEKFPKLPPNKAWGEVIISHFNFKYLLVSYLLQGRKKDFFS